MPAFLLQLFWQSRRKRENRLKQNAQKQKTARLGGFLRKNIAVFLPGAAAGGAIACVIAHDRGFVCFAV